MPNIVFNSSMPRACSTLLQNILAQNPDFTCTATDGLIELLGGARDKFSTVSEFKASLDQDLMNKAWINFCREGINGYTNTITNKANLVIKARGWKGALDWASLMLGYKPVTLILVRDLRAIVASFEKLFLSQPERISKWYIPNEVRGTTIFKRVDMYLTNEPLALDIDRLLELTRVQQDNNVLFIRAEDLCERPTVILNEIYHRMGLKPFKHDFNNVEQLVYENDVIHDFGKDLHKIRKRVTPLKNDYEEILGTELCNRINNDYRWYQEFFQYA